MHVAVLGAGIAGATAAYYLTEAGHSVTLIEREPSVAAATSKANGAQLSYSFTDSLARPEFLPRIPGLVAGRDPAIDVRLLRNPGLIAWGLRFLRQCTSGRARDNTMAVLEVAMRSARLLDRLLANVDIEFRHRAAGKLVVLADEKEIPEATERAAMKREYGCETEVLSPEEATSIEPSLDAMQQRFAAAIYSEGDQVGDARLFASGLIDWLRRVRQVEVSLGESVAAIETNGDALKNVRTDRRVLAPDAAVVCLGPWSGRLLKPIGINPHIYPVRGYSLTLPRGRNTPVVSVTNLEHRIVFSLLGEEVRIAGFADFVGLRTERDAARQECLLDVAKRLAPEAADYEHGEQQPWGGFRPVTPTSRPLVGPTRVRGLYLNTGHGVLGWTLACATGQDVAQAVSNELTRGR